MKKGILYSCFIIASFVFLNDVSFAKLTYQQINLLLENDDIQMFTISSVLVKKSSMSIEHSSDSSQSKTIVEYDEKGLLINYYSAAAIGSTAEAQRTMITTLMRNGDNKWQRKQTVGSYEIDNSLYVLKNNAIEITLLPSYDFNEERVILQHNNLLDSGEFGVIFEYKKPVENEKFSIEYLFDPKGSLNLYRFTNIDSNEYGYESMVSTQFEYDDRQRLVKANEYSHYQFMTELADSITTQIIYSNFDEYGNWLTKVEQAEGKQTVYKRTIEYWNS
ncbi:hypothetical protein DES39_1609 [Orbus hercynius]|uniref:Uncharacterized protein n=1 Tax=Orbus hercynius TaxID=593135 RepID=A0A495RCU0_9GAMM|nr:hypothetical protein [Orbus hercynius]RKS85100.1 hypothetical protein DES39_1609 [Orbus hercynius]